MRTRPTLATIGLCALFFTGTAHALPLPDSGSCPSNTPAFCLTVIQEADHPGVFSRADKNIAVTAVSTEDIGLFGESRDLHGVNGQSRHSNGVLGRSLEGQFTVAGIKGIAQAASAGIGVWGEAVGNGSGVYGQNTSANGWAGNFNGRVWAGGGLLQPSDRRLKKDVADLRYGLAQVLKLRPVSFRWKKGGDRLELGLIAQELRQHVPEVVEGDEATTHLSVNYPELLPVAIKAVQDQQAIITTLERRIAALEQRAHAPSASLVPGGVGTTLALGLLPVGLIAGVGLARARRKATWGSWRQPPGR